ncbi:MAG: hypothetical protein QXV32_02140 [Conexivisphaerales archaeon]
MKHTSGLVNTRHGYRWIAIEAIHRYILGMYIPVEAEEHHGCRALSKNPCQDVWYTCGIFR